MKTTTYEQLLAAHGDPIIRFDIIAERYLNMKPAIARRRREELPFPIFKLSDSIKAPYLVRLVDLAAYIDRQLPLDLQVPDVVTVEDPVAPAPTVTEVATAQVAPTREIKEYALGGNDTDSDAGISQAPQADSQPEDAGTGADGHSDSADADVQGA